MGGMASQPRTAVVGDGLALSQSTSHSGKRLRISSSAMRPSSRASALPMQKWVPAPKVMCARCSRWMSKTSPFGGKRRWSRLAAPMSISIAEPSGTVRP